MDVTILNYISIFRIEKKLHSYNTRYENFKHRTTFQYNFSIIVKKVIIDH